MLIRRVHAKAHAWAALFPSKRSLQPVGPSSSTPLGWFRLSPIDQYSSLLPPVGVWAVSQSQCGGPSSQNPYPMERTPIPCRKNPSVPMSCGFGTPPGINPPFGGLAPGKGQVGYALLTRAPVAGSNRRSGYPAAPRLACVRPVASVHPEPGSNSSL